MPTTTQDVLSDYLGAAGDAAQAVCVMLDCLQAFVGSHCTEPDGLNALGHLNAATICAERMRLLVIDAVETNLFDSPAPERTARPLTDTERQIMSRAGDEVEALGAHLAGTTDDVENRGRAQRLRCLGDMLQLVASQGHESPEATSALDRLGPLGSQ